MRRGLYRLKGRVADAAERAARREHRALFDCVPELRGRAEAIVRALLPGPYTLVLPNPGAPLSAG